MSDPFTIVVVGCGAAKRDERTAARDLYTSTYFDLKRRYAETAGDRWLILSAEHGLMGPDRLVEPYETSIDDLTVGELAAWAGNVTSSLDGMINWWTEAHERVTPIEVVLLAGSDYLGPIRPLLDVAPWDVRYPFDDTAGIGEQMGWLSDELARRRSA